MTNKFIIACIYLLSLGAGFANQVEYYGVFHDQKIFLNAKDVAREIDYHTKNYKKSGYKPRSHLINLSLGVIIDKKRADWIRLSEKGSGVWIEKNTGQQHKGNVSFTECGNWGSTDDPMVLQSRPFFLYPNACPMTLTWLYEEESRIYQKPGRVSTRTDGCVNNKHVSERFNQSNYNQRNSKFHYLVGYVGGGCSERMGLGWQAGFTLIRSDRLDYEMSKLKKSTNPKIAKENKLRDIFNSLSENERKELQAILKEEGFYKSQIDGKYGRGTESALKQFNNKVTKQDLSLSINIKKFFQTIMSHLEQE